MPLPHFAWPFRLGVTVEQNSPDELAAAAAVIVCTPRGHRDDDPSFGVTSPLFEQRPVDAERLASEIAQSDPRLQPTAEDIFDVTDAMRAVIGVDLSGAPARA